MTNRELTPMQAILRARQFWLGAALAFIVSCGGGSSTAPPPPPPGAVASVVLTPGSESIVVGAGQQFTATVKDANNNVLTGRTVTWTSSNPSHAVVTDAGLVVGQYHGGPVTIRATVDGVAGTATVTVLPPQKPSLVELRSVMDTAQAAFIRTAEQTNGNAVLALAAAASSMEADPRVKNVFFVDTTTIQIELKTGMLTVLRINAVGADGRSVSRGGGDPRGSTLTRFRRSENLITNKKVLICAARVEEFYAPGELDRLADIARNSGLGLNVTVLKDDQCSWQAVQSFPSYGLVIIDTHGLPNGFLVSGKVRVQNGGQTDSAFKAAVDAENGPGTYDGLTLGDFGTTWTYDVGPNAGKWWQEKWYGSRTFQLLVTSQFIRRLSMPNTVVFGNMCYSGTISDTPFLPTGFLQPAFMSTGVASYFGYAFLEGDSYQVPNDKAKEYEELFLKAMTVDADSTGIAHLDENSQERIAGGVREHKIVNGVVTVGQSRELHWRQFGHPDFSYVKVSIDPDPAEGEFGKPIDFVAEDEGSAPEDAIYEWDFGDGTPKVRVNELPLVQHTFELPPGTTACEEVSFEVKLDLLNPASGTPAKVATAEATALLQSPCPNWKLTTFVDVDELVDPPGTDPGQGGAFFDLLWGAESAPGSALITISGDQLSMRVKRAGVWETCCTFGGDDHVWIWPTWSQSTTDLGSGTVTGVRTEGQSEFRIQATRNGMTMTGTMTLRVSTVDDETGEPRVVTYLFTFTAERMG